MDCRQDKVLQGWVGDDGGEIGTVWQVCEGVRVGRACCMGVVQDLFGYVEEANMTVDT